MLVSGTEGRFNQLLTPLKSLPIPCGMRTPPGPRGPDGNLGAPINAPWNEKSIRKLSSKSFKFPTHWIKVGAHWSAWTHSFVGRHLAQWTGSRACIVSDAIDAVAAAHKSVVMKCLGLARVVALVPALRCCTVEIPEDTERRFRGLAEGTHSFVWTQALTTTRSVGNRAVRPM